MEVKVLKNEVTMGLGGRNIRSTYVDAGSFEVKDPFNDFTKLLQALLIRHTN